MPLVQFVGGTLDHPFVICPQCSSIADRVGVEDGGAVSEIIWSPDVTKSPRKVRPATFWACMRCEWCGEKSVIVTAQEAA